MCTTAVLSHQNQEKWYVNYSVYKINFNTSISEYELQVQWLKFFWSPIL